MWRFSQLWNKSKQNDRARPLLLEAWYTNFLTRCGQMLIMLPLSDSKRQSLCLWASNWSSLYRFTYKLEEIFTVQLVRWSPVSPLCVESKCCSPLCAWYSFWTLPGGQTCSEMPLWEDLVLMEPLSLSGGHCGLCRITTSGSLNSICIWRTRCISFIKQS